MKTSHSLTTVLTSSQMHLINIAKSLLENSGIKSYIFDENLTLTIGTAFVEGYKLKVNSSNIEKAKSTLKKLTNET